MLVAIQVAIRWQVYFIYVKCFWGFCVMNIYTISLLFFIILSSW